MSTRMSRAATAVAVVAAVSAGLLPPAAASPVPGCPLPTFGPGPSYDPLIERASFTPNVTNRLFPLKVGRTLVYTGLKDGKVALNLATTTAKTKFVDGVRTRVVEDRLYLDNILEERTSDYYAQDRCGNVWYFGEDTATLDPGGRVVSTEGSFHAGVDGAKAGVFMTAQPQLGRQFRQEWSRGHAEDVFQAIALDAAVRVPLGSFRHALRTSERTDLEPAVLDNKFYVRGIGEVAELSVRGPAERLRLVAIIG